MSQEEKDYRWLEAAKSYEKALHSTAVDPALAVDYWQRIGFCYSLASRQTRNSDEFKQLLEQAIFAYETASKLFGENTTLENQGRSAECLAAAEYARSWGAYDSNERQINLDKCRTLCRKALAAFRKAGDELRYGKTANMLSLCLSDRIYLTPTLEEKRRIIQEASDNVDDAITILSKAGDIDELLFAFSAASLLTWYVANVSEQEEELANKCLDYSEEALSIYKQSTNPYSKAMAMWAAVYSTLYFSEKIEDALDYAKEMCTQASLLRDNYFNGVACYLLAHATDFKIPLEADQDKKKQEYEEIIRYAEDSIRYLKLVNQDLIIADSYLLYVQSYCSLAREFALNPAEKLALSQKAVEIGEKGLEHAVHSGSPEAMGSTLHALSKAFQYHSNLEQRKVEKRQLLKSALSYRKKYISTVEKAFASNLWTIGVGLVYAAQIQADLARMESDEETKTTLLKEAVADMELGVSHCNRWFGSRIVPWRTAVVAGFEDSYGGMLNEYHVLTEDEESLAKANKAYSDAAEKFKRVDLPSRVAESYWKIARNLDLSGDHHGASQNFENAFAGYKAAAQKIHQFSEFYLDYANYMKAWSEIQSAELAHSTGKHLIAIQHYERASDLLKQSKSWSYLSSNFHAWAHLERAEDFSRKENCREAINSFEQTIRLFKESEQTLQAQLKKIGKDDEKDLVMRLIEASNTREAYGHGRVQIEQAKILDEQGFHAKSSGKYEAAAATFEKLSQTDSEQTRKEVKPLIYLCQAWQKMTMAEARSSSALYAEAADLFKLATEYTTDESASRLALAHSSFCKALEAGTEFERTRKNAMYTEAKKHMDAAANYYLKAGFEAASEYAKATQRLFDAYVFMDNAKRETDPEKEARHYLMAEKVLQLSAESYTKARHAEKTDQVQRLLRKVREERELALSLSEVLHAPTITSSTASFATISLSEEKAVGLERFEHADIQAKLVQYGENPKVGEDVNLGIQIVNVGKEPVFLTKIENILPKGFQFTGKPDSSAFEESHLVMKGNRLEPLKADEIRLSFKPFMKADAEIKPRIICVDETGRQMLYELEPKILHVSEAVLPGRVNTGFEDLDNLLLGGIPENYAIALTSPSCDERTLIIKRFLEAGIKSDQTTFYITVEPGEAMALAEKFQSTFYLFICNPRANAAGKSLPNVITLKGVESLTDIDIALTKTLRMLDPSRTAPKRACLEIISDVLLQHHAVITRRWLSGLLPHLRTKGFTTLAVVNPHMHPLEEVQAILGLFEGEVELSEKETKEGVERILKVKKLINQRHLENEMIMEKSFKTHQ